MGESPRRSVAILIPVFNDWVSLEALLPALSAALAEDHLDATVVIVDDGSSEPCPLARPSDTYPALRRIVLLTLRRNLGHQRAIAVGLAAVHQRLPHDIVVVMDGDGEDRPEDVPRLVRETRRLDGRAVVFAERTRRSEGLVFALCYHLYRVAHLILTGERVRFGNFSAVPWSCLERLVSVSELWGHYAAAVVRSRVPYGSIRTDRATRLAGRTTMRFTALVVHGLSALAIFSDVIGVRFLLTATVGVVGGAAWIALAGPLALRAAPASRFGAELFVVGFLLLVVGLGAVLGFTFMILAGRKSSEFIPLRDYEYFILGMAEL